jgi:hypothetical protein
LGSERPGKLVGFGEDTPQPSTQQLDRRAQQTGSVTPRKIAVALSAPTFFVIGAAALTCR